MSMEKLAKDLSAIINESNTKKTKAYDTAAEVVRVEGDTVWVHIPGGVDETPVKRTMSAQVGDTVQVRVSGGTAWLQGNATNPPTDDTTANAAYSVAMTTNELADSAADAAERARASASEAWESAEEAEEEAGRATRAANNATTAANKAMTGLATVEDVVGVVTWMKTHGNYKVSTDTTPQENTIYFSVSTVASPTGNPRENMYYEYDSSTQEYSLTLDTSVATGKTYYTITEQTPAATDNPSQNGWIELTNLQDVVSDYVNTHLALTDKGLYVLGDESEWKVLVGTDGVYIIDSENNVVSYYKDEIILGKDDGSQSFIRLDYHSMQMFDKENAVSRNSPYFWISDLRDKNGIHTIEDDTVTGNGNYNIYATFDIFEMIHIYVDEVEIPSSDYTLDSSDPKLITFNSIIPIEADIKLTYKSKSDKLKAYTLGLRKSSSKIGGYSLAEGFNTTASGGYSHAEGFNTTASGICSHAEGGDNTTASGSYSHAEGFNTTASGICSHAEGGDNTTASGYYSHAEGRNTTASGTCSHAEGFNTTASGMYSHAEGFNTTASGARSHAEGGDNTTASGIYSHAEGRNTTSSDMYSHAEGFNTTASGSISHAEGYEATASGYCSHAQNRGTIAAKICQTAIGRYNVEDTESVTNKQKAFIIGNGSKDTNRSNAFTVDWEGNVEASGDIEDGQGNVLSEKANSSALPTVTSPTISITDSVGTLESATVQRYGNVVQLTLIMSHTGSTAIGDSAYEGTIKTTALRPLQVVTSGHYYGNRAMTGNIAANGKIIVRNTGGSVINNMTNHYMSFTYIVA